MQKIIEKIKSMHWDNRVQRPGFLQPKAIINDAETLPVQLTEGVIAKYDSVAWVKQSNLYDQEKTETFPDLFVKAFAKDRDWPLSIMNIFSQFTKQRDEFLCLMAKDWNNEEIESKKQAFGKYIELLKAIEKYYVIAVPLTNYCEKELKAKDASLLEYAWEYARLDMDTINESLQKIKKSSQGREEHCKRFGWIKTTYNIIHPYTLSDVEKEIESDIPHIEKADPPNSEFRYLLNGLQIGIFLRNRMKELSQQIWFAFENLAQSMAEDINLPRDDFFQLTPEEVFASLENHSSTVSAEEIKNRHKGFIVGIIDNKPFLISGKIADELQAFFNTVDTKGITEIKGTPACKGRVQGTVKVILSHDDFSLLENGDILVTSMTTPDYIIIMKKAAAIVTDEGGLSCHAAIVSRELGIPCVIGTKIATKVLCDGDEVEVDADHGTIKLLKRHHKP